MLLEGARIHGPLVPTPNHSRYGCGYGYGYGLGERRKAGGVPGRQGEWLLEGVLDVRHLPSSENSKTIHVVCTVGYAQVVPNDMVSTLYDSIIGHNLQKGLGWKV